ncbi:MAG: GIY-YIG nuclease family protein [Asgard group archaeon]|nr:GIY-YIG nuclease family protein [Asgard group archaeon]
MGVITPNFFLGENIMSEKGTYLLFVKNEAKFKTIVGSAGEIEFPKGCYLYIGSAFGRGGLNGRINRHKRLNKKIFWHIDFLLSSETVTLVLIGKIFSDKRWECPINIRLKDFFSDEKLTHIINFGSSDCQCVSHLYYYNEELTEELIQTISLLIAPNEIVIQKP